MMIVLGVIMVLATMVVMVATRIENQSREKVVRGTFEMLDGALQEYYDYWKTFPNPNPGAPKYPTSSAALYGQLNSTPESRKILEKISPKLIRSNPAAVDMPEICDPWAVPIDYAYAPGESYPRLRSAGPDRVLGNGDDITNR